ncbi:MAG: DUF4124 domain-containing protein [Gammaproteobacteria bacterium]|jgi:hypothetical protein
MRTLFITLLLTLAAVTAHAEDVYRTVQSDGTVVYSDRPLSSDSVKITLNTRLSEEARVAAEASAAAAAAAAQAGSGDDDMAAALAEQQRLRAEACQKAREALALYERSPRLYETLPDGGRRYLSDEEIATARMEARRAVADFCEPEPGN